uniref:Uncharacterized protein n=1 Tax=Monodon monoceros TaxID=40151 RepID=A0A8C6F4S7_MONMO
MKRESTLKFITSLLPTMKSATCISCQAGRQMRREKEKFYFFMLLSLDVQKKIRK